jgi:hypothetical protein
VFAILHFPGLRPYVEGPYPRLTPFDEIDSLRDNWWFENVSGNVARPIDSPQAAVGFPDFLSAAEKQSASVENGELSALGPASQYLPRVVIDWGKKHPHDPRVPEALYLAIRAVRYGSSNEWNHEAFLLLHQNYPNSEWAKKTPYWFK